MLHLLMKRLSIAAKIAYMNQKTAEHARIIPRYSNKSIAIKKKL